MPVVAGALAMLCALAACSGGAEPVAESRPEATSSATEEPPAEEPGAAEEFDALEGEFDALLGVYAVDTGTGREVAHRADERFAYASTFKALLVGAVLDEHGANGLDEVISYTADDLLDNSPVTENFVDAGMSLRELCAAALWYSDNAAANLLLDVVGGPGALEAWLRQLGDDTTRMDRWEPDLSEGTPGDDRDTSTPRALAADLRALLLGDGPEEALEDALGDAERALLRQWMETNTTGETLVRAGVPAEWTVADKSGTAGYGGRNNIAVLWPDDGGEPIVLAVMSRRDQQGAERDDALIARAATVAVESLGR
ncbi:class A beta-lactamase [Streptomyces sp. 3MP-14]|uniref:Beta-lactamase n=2 Tax=Streptomyces TaxID=1883 RepID=A0A5N6A678_9ACTN|nr:MULTISPECIES: class A beta-lactamase [Streptomyces]KAB8164171.1 class A beta-lactamase [Streptomyces mimosae]KAB8176448.1 class A beta-lactamase [Streptomyces sp. 3MP-14]